MKKTVAILTAVILAGAGVAHADGIDPIEIRQATMDLVSADYAGIRAVVAAKGDVKPLENRAKAIQRFAALDPTLFPKGSETGNNTKALPEIWSDFAGFQKASAALGEASGKLAAAARAGDADAVATEIKAVGDTCGACHRSYQAK
jgi:cytochrome c556